MSSEPAAVCERVSRATKFKICLAGAPHPHREFRDLPHAPGILQYELLHVTRSLDSLVIERGFAKFSTRDNSLRRVMVERSMNGNSPMIFNGRAASDAYFVRVPVAKQLAKS